MSKVFVVAVDNRVSNDKGDQRTITNYYLGIQMGFRSWTADPTKAQRFDTRAIAKKAARECERSARVETLDIGATPSPRAEVDRILAAREKAYAVLSGIETEQAQARSPSALSAPASTLSKDTTK